MKFAKLGVLPLILVVASIMLVACGNGGGNGNGKITDPGGEFEYSVVIVSLTENASLENRVWFTSDFPGFDFDKIQDLGIANARRILFFYLSNPSRENVLKAVYYLRSRLEVHSAEPNWLGVGGV